MRYGFARKVDTRKGHKYRAVPTVVDGIRFHSKAEAKRYGELKLLEKAGEVRGLTLQEEFPLYVTRHAIKDSAGHVQIGLYVADFSYEQCMGADRWLEVVEDVKGFMTPLARWKIKHVAAQYGIEVKVIK